MSSANTFKTKPSRPMFYRPDLGTRFLPISPLMAKSDITTSPKIVSILYSDGSIWDKTTHETMWAPKGLLRILEATHSVTFDEGVIEFAPETTQAIEPPSVSAKKPAIPTVLEEANTIIFGDREQTYGHPAKNINNIARQWSLYLEQKHGLIMDISAEDVCWMMVTLKMARQINSSKRDNLVDAAGYLALIDRIDKGNRND